MRDISFMAFLWRKRGRGALTCIKQGQEVFTAEIEAAWFKKVEQVDLLKDN